MKKNELATGIMLFSTILGLVMPVGGQVKQSGLTQNIVAKADDTSNTDTTTQDIADATSQVNEAVSNLKANANEVTDASNLQTYFEQNLSNLNVDSTLQGYVDSYQNGSITQDAFQTNVKALIAKINGLATPADWERASELVNAIASQKDTLLKNSNLSSDLLTKDESLLSVQTGHFDNSYISTSSGITYVNVSNLTTQVANALNKIFDIGITPTTGTGKPDNGQLVFAESILEQIEASREDAVKNDHIGSATDAQKQSAINNMQTQLEDDKTLLQSDSITNTMLNSYMGAPSMTITSFYKQFQNIAPVTDTTAASALDKETAQNALDATYSKAQAKLNAIQSSDTQHYADAQNSLKTIQNDYTAATTAINNAGTNSDLNTVLTKAQATITADASITHTASSDEKTAAITAITDAATAAKKTINATTAITDATKQSLSNSIDTWVDSFKTAINIDVTEDSVVASRDNGISLIQGIASPYVNASQLTAEQKVTAINAVITAGNTKKLAIQNNSSISDEDKATAYTAIDKLITDAETSINAATTKSALDAAQQAGTSSISAYTAPTTTTAKVTTEQPVTQTTTAKEADTAKTKTSTKKYVYATAKIKVYKSSNLTGKTVASYAKKTRQNRPSFEVLKSVKNKSNKTVYQVLDLQNGKTGYITSSSKTVGNLYYQSSATKIKVIDNKGINRYKKTSLSGKTYHYKKGANIKVKKIVHYKNATRFQLTNGQYVTANKTFVMTIG